MELEFKLKKASWENIRIERVLWLRRVLRTYTGIWNQFSDEGKRIVKHSSSKSAGAWGYLKRVSQMYINFILVYQIVRSSYLTSNEGFFLITNIRTENYSNQVQLKVFFWGRTKRVMGYIEIRICASFSVTEICCSWKNTSLYGPDSSGYRS